MYSLTGTLNVLLKH